MKRTESVEFLLQYLRPGRTRKQGPDAFNFDRPHKDRTIEERTAAALRHFSGSLHFLAGVLTMFPLLGIQNPMLKSDAENLLLEGQKLSFRRERTTAFIRQLRKHEEKIDRIVVKIEKSAKQ
jgi:hypothetical protein